MWELSAMHCDQGSELVSNTDDEYQVQAYRRLPLVFACSVKVPVTTSAHLMFSAPTLYVSLVSKKTYICGVIQAVGSLKAFSRYRYVALHTSVFCYLLRLGMYHS